MLGGKRELRRCSRFMFPATTWRTLCPSFPEFLLRALYVKGSLKSDGDGFRFQVKNDLGPARIIGARPLTVNRKPIPLEQCRFVHGDQEATFNQVTADQSVLMRKGEAVTIHVQETALRRGRHTIGINFIVKDMGQVSFSINDQLK